MEKKNATFSLSPNIIQKLEANAKEKGMTKSAYITMLINQDSSK